MWHEPPQDEGIYELIRPLLAQPREEIEAFLRECGQSYCMDETNLDTEYSRNRIRHQVLPELKQINGQAVAHINQSAALLQEMRDFLNEEAEHIREMYVVEKSDGIQLIRACGRSATKLCSGRFSIRQSDRCRIEKRYYEKTCREREKPLFFTGWTICGTAISGAGGAQLSWYFAEKRDGKKGGERCLF